MPTSRTKVGDINRNGQKLLAKTDVPGNDHMQYVWNVECTRKSVEGIVCGHRYGLNGSDFFQRKCPICQDGLPGLPFVEVQHA